MLKYFTNTKIYLHCAAVLVVVTIAISCYYLMASFSQQQTTTYLYIDDNDTQDSVYNKLTDIASTPGMAALRTLCRHSGYAEQVRTGRYAIEPGVSTFRIWRKVHKTRSTSLSPNHEQWNDSLPYWATNS